MVDTHLKLAQAHAMVRADDLFVEAMANDLMGDAGEQWERACRESQLLERLLVMRKLVREAMANDLMGDAGEQWERACRESQLLERLLDYGYHLKPCKTVQEARDFISEFHEDEKLKNSGS